MPKKNYRSKRKKRNNTNYQAILFGGVILLIVGMLIASIISNNSNTSAQTADMQDEAGDDPYLGPEDAPVVIVEFSDYLCPFCGQFYWETLPLILEAYPDEVKFVHRDFVLMGDTSTNALLAGGCAHEQDMFWELSDILFEKYKGMDFSQGHPKEEGGPESMNAYFADDKLVEYAEQAGLDMEAFNTCMAAGDLLDEIYADHQAAQDLGINSIPAYFINGEAMIGFRSFEEIQPLIEAALAEAGY